MVTGLGILCFVVGIFIPDDGMGGFLSGVGSGLFLSLIFN